MKLNTYQSLSYLFWPKYIKAKKDNVLTKAIKYHPVEELLVISAIYSDSASEELIICEKIVMDNIKNIKRI